MAKYFRAEDMTKNTKNTNANAANATKKAVRIPLARRDTLSRHGYSEVTSLSNADRHLALLGAISEFGWTYVIRKLNVLAIYNKNRSPGLARLFRRDMVFVQGVRDAVTA